MDELLIKNVSNMNERNIFKAQLNTNSMEMLIHMYDAPSKYIEKENVRNILEYQQYYLMSPVISNRTLYS